MLATSIGDGLTVPADPVIMSLSDWAARLAAASGTSNAAVGVRPGEFVLNLRYGDVDYNGMIDLFDYLAVANAAVGNDELIIETDGPTRDVDLVVAGNVFPTNLAGECGREADGTRVLDLFDVLSIANGAVGFPEPCVGSLIPGRGPLATNVVVVPGGDLPSTTTTWTKVNVYRIQGLVRVQAGTVP
jgi:hypothetical protein